MATDNRQPRKYTNRRMEADAKGTAQLPKHDIQIQKAKGTLLQDEYVILEEKKASVKEGVASKDIQRTIFFAVNIRCSPAYTMAKQLGTQAARMQEKYPYFYEIMPRNFISQRVLEPLVTANTENKNEWKITQKRNDKNSPPIYYKLCPNISQNRNGVLQQILVEMRYTLDEKNGVLNIERLLSYELPMQIPAFQGKSMPYRCSMIPTNLSQEVVMVYCLARQIRDRQILPIKTCIWSNTSILDKGGK